jgi:hypothetical protein
MERQNKNEIIKLIGGLTAISMIGTGLYYLYNFMTKKKLPNWLEDEIRKVREKIVSHDTENLSFEIKCSVFNIVMEVQDFLYYENYSVFDERRLTLLGKEEEYSKAVDLNLDYRESCFEKAIKKVSKYLGVNSLILRHILESIDDKEKFTRTLEKIRISYPQDELPQLDKETVKIAYLEYLTHLVILTENNKRQNEISRQRRELEEIVSWLYYQNKMVLSDTIMKNYKIKEKYFPQLVNSFKLTEEKEIAEKLKILKTLNSENDL